jgi:hypothetical protein
MYMAKVEHWHIHVDTNGDVIGKPMNVVPNVALTTHPPSSAEVKEEEDLYFYSPSVTSWHLLS